MSWGESSFFFQGAGSKDPPVGFVICGLVNKSLFYQTN